MVRKPIGGADYDVIAFGGCLVAVAVGGLAGLAATFRVGPFAGLVCFLLAGLVGFAVGIPIVMEFVARTR